MKLLLFSDLHCDLDACVELVEKSNQVDMLIGAGDFGNLRRNIDTTINALCKITKATVVVPGNSESYDELRAACLNWPSAIVLHGSKTNINGQTFYGIGGGIPVTPFGSWSWDFNEYQASVLLKDFPSQAILVSHSPPKGILDRSSSGQSLGSSAIKEVLEKKKPKLLVCGHIHESCGQSKVFGESIVINAGPKGIFWEL